MMRVKFISGSPKTIAATALAAFAAAMGLVAAYLHHSAAGAAERCRTAKSDLAEDVELAAKFRKMSAEALVFSADANEARSSTFLEQAVRQNHVNNPIIHSDPEESGSGVTRIRTHVDCDGSTLAAVVGFMREVEAGRPNLALISARLDRQDPNADAWNAKIVYLALIRAK